MTKITNENYYSDAMDKEYMSVSQYKAMMSCSALAMARYNGTFPKQTGKALLVGSYVDAYFEGTIDEFKSTHPELYQKNGKLYADFAHAEIMIKRAEQNPKFMQYMNGKKQEILTGEIFGVMWKAKLDVLGEKHIADLKTCANLKDIGKWGYHYQGAIYQELVRQKTGEKLPFYLCCVSKEKVPELGIIQIPQPILDEALSTIEMNLPHIMDIKNGLVEPDRCEECDYCKTTKELRVENYADYM